MESGPTFPHLHVGFKRDVGEGQWMRGDGNPLARPGTAAPSLRFAAGESMRPCFPEKRRATEMRAVPKPTQVGGYKDTKARGRNLVKELGNMAP